MSGSALFLNWRTSGSVHEPVRYLTTWGAEPWQAPVRTTETETTVLLADELLLLALDPEKGRPVNSSREPLKVCLCGALVAELGLDGHVALQGKRFEVTGSVPPAGILREASDVLTSSKGRRAADQLRRLDKALGGIWKRIVDAQVDQGVLGRRQDRVVLWSVTRHPVLRTDLRDEVVGRMRSAAAGDGPLDPHTAVVLALSGPARLLEVVAPDRPRAKAKRRIEEATDMTPVAPAVKKVIAEVQAAAAVAAAGAAAAANGH